LWLDNVASQELVTLVIEDSARNYMQEVTERQPAAKRAGYRAAAATDACCPMCGKAMIPYTTDADKHGVRVNLDVCSHHGTWFDHGEAWSLYQGISLERMAVAFSIDMDARDAAWNQQQGAWGTFLSTTTER
jgi:hypothetical protein